MTARYADFDPRREVDCIRSCAREGRATIVTRGPLVFFSTRAGDAWVLDAEDQFAACVMRKRDEVAFEIGDAGAQWSIRWPSTFVLEGARIRITDRGSGITSSIGGAVVRELGRSLLLVRNWR